LALTPVLRDRIRKRKGDSDYSSLKEGSGYNITNALKLIERLQKLEEAQHG